MTESKVYASLFDDDDYENEEDQVLDAKMQVLPIPKIAVRKAALEVLNPRATLQNVPLKLFCTRISRKGGRIVIADSNKVLQLVLSRSFMCLIIEFNTRIAVSCSKLSTITSRREGGGQMKASPMMLTRLLHRRIWAPALPTSPHPWQVAHLSCQMKSFDLSRHHVHSFVFCLLKQWQHAKSANTKNKSHTTCSATLNFPI